MSLHMYMVAGLVPWLLGNSVLLLLRTCNAIHQCIKTRIAWQNGRAILASRDFP